MSLSNNVFWGLDGISGIVNLFKKQTLLDIFPNKIMTLDEKLNAISRFLIYLGIIISIYQRSLHFLIYSTIGLSIIYIWYKFQSKPMIEAIQVNDPDNSLDTNIKNYKGYWKNKHKEKERKSIIKPNKENPFMNVLPETYIKTPNCVSQIEDTNVNYEDLQQDITNNFNEGLFQEVSDIYGKMSSQRQFYTMPNTSIPNDQGEFADWLYQTPSTCKEGNGLACEKNNSPRLMGNLSELC